RAAEHGQFSKRAVFRVWDAETIALTRTTTSRDQIFHGETALPSVGRQNRTYCRILCKAGCRRTVVPSRWSETGYAGKVAFVRDEVIMECLGANLHQSLHVHLRFKRIV